MALEVGDKVCGALTRNVYIMEGVGSWWCRVRGEDGSYFVPPENLIPLPVWIDEPHPTNAIHAVFEDARMRSEAYEGVSGTRMPKTGAEGVREAWRGARERVVKRPNLEAIRRRLSDAHDGEGNLRFSGDDLGVLLGGCHRMLAYVEHLEELPATRDALDGQAAMEEAYERIQRLERENALLRDETLRMLATTAWAGEEGHRMVLSVDREGWRKWLDVLGEAES